MDGVPIDTRALRISFFLWMAKPCDLTFKKYHISCVMVRYRPKILGKECQIVDKKVK